jgi:ectoine hydroxylase-related dioxygenase (phytanoyl-CoA dioxygenase family)
MRQIFSSNMRQSFFEQHGFVVVDLLDDADVIGLLSFYEQAFRTRRQVVPYAEKLSYYISIFDKDSTHKREVDQKISKRVSENVHKWMIDYEVFYSNFMIKFPGDGQIEAHQDFNFVDESRHTAFNLWCPLVDTSSQNGGLFVIPGSHKAFLTQRGPNIPKALTEYNETFRKYARLVPAKRGQAVIFDHKLVHCSPPNRGDTARVAIQSVLFPKEAAPVHYLFDMERRKIRAYRVTKEFILENNLWEPNTNALELDHEQELIPFPSAAEVTRKLTDLALTFGRERNKEVRPTFRDPQLQSAFDRDGFVKLRLLTDSEINDLKETFFPSTGGHVANTEYGMYISLEEEDVDAKRLIIEQISKALLPRLDQHFIDCKPHLGSFLVKAPQDCGYTYPHQDWTFVDPPSVSATVWVALVDVNDANGNLGFVKGSHNFFDSVVGSPSPEFQTPCQGHESVLYEYLEFVPLTAGEAVVFDNRTVHGATPNLSSGLRIAAAIGMTPREAPLYHYSLLKSDSSGARRIAKLKVDASFFVRHTLRDLKKAFQQRQLPTGSEVAEIFDEEFLPFTDVEIREFCKRAGLVNNKRKLVRAETKRAAAAGRSVFGSTTVSRIWRVIFGS